MKGLFFILLLMVSYLGAQTCPPKGDNKHPDIVAADLLKNRQYFPQKDKAKAVLFSTLASDGAKDTGAIYVDAFITSAKISGIESCECHIADKSFLDYHIYISDAPGNIAKSKNQVVEVSRYSRALNPALTFAYVKTLVGHKVRVYGYTFMDDEHKAAIGNWRAGIQEIHPVFYIDKLD